MARRRSRALGVTAAAVGLILLLTGCVTAFFSEPTPVPTESEIVGTWLHDSGGSWFASEGPRSQMNFLADRRVELQNIPPEVFAGFSEADVLQSFTGVWEAPERCEDERVCLFISLDHPAPIGGMSMYFEGSGDTLEVYFRVGDIEKAQRYSFHRVK